MDKKKSSRDEYPSHNKSQEKLDLQKQKRTVKSTLKKFDSLDDDDDSLYDNFEKIKK